MIHRVPNPRPILPSVVSNNQAIHGVSMRDRKHKYLQSNATTTMAILMKTKS